MCWMPLAEIRFEEMSVGGLEGGRAQGLVFGSFQRKVVRIGNENMLIAAPLIAIVA